MEEDFRAWLNTAPTSAQSPLRLRSGMFFARRGRSAGATPASKPALIPDIGAIASPYTGPAPLPDFPVGAPVPRCPLLPLPPGMAVSAGRVPPDLRFSPAFANIVKAAAGTLSKRGIPIEVTAGFRTAADQARMRRGGSGRNPAALFSDHQLGNAIDVNTMSPSFPMIKAALEQAGAQWGGDYRSDKDRVHFYIRPVAANARNTARCEQENPR